MTAIAGSWRRRIRERRDPDARRCAARVHDWIDIDGGDVLFTTAEGRVKTGNIARDRRVAISDFEHIDRLTKKYLDVEIYPWSEPGERRVTVRVRPDRVSPG